MTECHKELQQLMDSQVSVVTNDGRTMFGTLKGLDQKLNVILEECKERVFSKDEGVEEVGVAELGMGMLSLFVPLLPLLPFSISPSLRAGDPSARARSMHMCAHDVNEHLLCAHA